MEFRRISSLSANGRCFLNDNRIFRFQEFAIGEGSIHLIRFFRAIGNVACRVRRATLSLISSERQGQVPHEGSFRSTLRPIHAIRNRTTCHIFASVLLRFGRRHAPIIANGHRNVISFQRNIFRILSFFGLRMRVSRQASCLQGISGSF